MSVSTFSRIFWMPFSACTPRRRPSKLNGRVAMPMVERAGGLGHLGHDRAAAGAGAAALAEGDEHHVGALEHLFDLVAVVLGGLTADLGIGARAEPAGDLPADVELHVGVAHEQRLGVGVHRDELDALQPGVDHPVDGVAPAAADADDLDHREVVLRLAQHDVASFARRRGSTVVGGSHCGAVDPSWYCPGISGLFRQP